MSASDSFAFNALHKGIGARVLLVEFDEPDADAFRQRLQMLAASTPISRVDCAPLWNALLPLEAVRHHIVFIRLHERHMGGDCAAMEAFLARLVTRRSAVVIPVAGKRVTVDYFRHRLCHVSPVHLGLAIRQKDLLNIFDAYASPRSVMQSDSLDDVHF
jgi:hypothetical protein